MYYIFITIISLSSGANFCGENIFLFACRCFSRWRAGESDALYIFCLPQKTKYGEKKVFKTYVKIICLSLRLVLNNTLLPFAEGAMKLLQV